VENYHHNKVEAQLKIVQAQSQKYEQIPLLSTVSKKQSNLESFCCKCHSQGAKCINCRCNKSGMQCTNCLPIKDGKCSNSTNTLPIKFSQDDTPFSGIRTSLSIDYNIQKGVTNVVNVDNSSTKISSFIDQKMIQAFGATLLNTKGHWETIFGNISGKEWLR